MTINRRTVTVGVAALGLAGLAGGGIAWAATETNAPSATMSLTSSHCGGAHGMYGKYSPMTAMANYLGLSRTELINQMHAGKTLAQIAKSQGKTIDGLKAATLSAMKRNLAADTSLTSAQRTAILALMQNHLDAMLTGTHMSGMDTEDMGSAMLSGTSGAMMGGSGSRMMGH